MSESTNRRLIRTTSRFAFFIALATFLAVPSIYLWTALSYEHSRLHIEAEHRAGHIAKLIYVDPEHWRFQETRLEEMLLDDAAGADRRRRAVLALDGQEIVSVGKAHGFFSIAGETSLENGDGTVSTVVVEHSSWPILVSTGTVALFSLALSLATYFVLKTLPLRALKLVVSDLEHSEIMLRAEKESAELANRAKTEFLANMSHELRTPLNAIIGFSEIMKDQAFGPVGDVRYREYAKDIHNSGQHLLGIISDILDLSRIEIGKGELQESETDIEEVVRSVQAFVADRAQDTCIELISDVPGGLPRLYVDERKLMQMLVNLLTNAVKFTETGGSVTLRVRRGADDGFVFQVIDTGIGIAPQDIPKAMSQFGQIDGGLARTEEGAGLGLPLTKALVELHDGSLELHSELGVGTTVTLRFPAKRILGAPAGNRPSPMAHMKAG